MIAFNLVFLIFLLAFSSNKKQEAPVNHQNVKPSASKVSLDKTNFTLIGTEKGLYYWDFEQEPVLLWDDGAVKEIVRVPYGIFLMTEQGIIFSSDLKNFHERNNGLRFKVIKHYDNQKKSFTREIQDLKDLSADPFNPERLITCTKDGVFYTLDQGREWHFLRNPTSTSGIKAVAIYSNPDLQLIFSHPFKGVYHRNISKKGRWEKRNEGLKRYSGLYEEVSDILVEREGKEVKILAANNFSPNVYRWDERENKWKTLFQLKEKFSLIESLFLQDDRLAFVSNLGVMEFSKKEKKLNKIHLDSFYSLFKNKTGEHPSAIYMVKEGSLRYKLSQLWLSEEKELKKFAKVADGKKGVYTQAHIVRSKSMREKLVSMMKKVGMNMLVIDMKDDYGKLRFTPTSPLLKKMGVVSNPVHLESFIKYMKKNGIYTVARLVVFKDKVLYNYNQHQYAVRDRMTGKPWRGIVGKDEEGKPKYNWEYWVDPYSEEVWHYNIEIAQVLLKQGFDEIQFDYIRFPTDGENLSRVTYPYQDRGMDKEGALISFLKYARKNIPGPISIDIYGSNGWHRTGARTGQEVEMLQKYVDVICPMYYPSHFAQKFLYYPPYEKRPYRIYYKGSLRNYYIAKKNVVIRPYLQAFKMQRYYDKLYYGPGYISGQVQGVDDSINMGYTFWNSGSKYSILLDALVNDKKQLSLKEENLKEETEVGESES
jgi:hypothetical protein